MKKWMISLILLALPAAGCSGTENGEGAARTPIPSVIASSTPTTAATGSPVSTKPSASPSPAASAKPAVSPHKTQASAPSSPAPSSSSLTSAAAKAAIEERAKETMSAIKSKDWTGLEKLVHPDQGLRLSPYCYVDVKKDIVFPKGQVAKLAADPSTREWGSYDGSGEPIKLTFAQFYDKFLYNHDYAKPEKTGYNETFGKSNTKNNIREVYPGAIVVEYYFNGFDTKLAGQDWASLSLVFEKKGDTWYLSAMVHNQWTI
ncbi:hypothetical protein [Gorillibacterium sp. sgz5001074]|uniref:hypothetical protein n=1 Tax=Gorillibacterium sp. sgz5001074 TaxID=3446695 RepID=UPI003F667F06